MNQPQAPATNDIPKPVDGKFVFQIDADMRVRFNADGWAEEIGKGGDKDPLGSKLQAKPNTKMDDLLARRYYDLLSRVVILDIHPQKVSSVKSGASGIILFKDLELGSPIYNRVQKLIVIANTHFNMNLKPLT